MKQTIIKKENGFTGSIVTAECGIRIPSFNEVYNCKSDFFLSYAPVKNETAIVIPGNDGIGVFFCVLSGDYRNELKEICDNEDNPLGECLRFATHHKNNLKEGSGIFAFPDFLSLK